MTALRPTTIAELAATVPSQPRWVVRGGGTKPALAASSADVPVLDLSALAGLVEYKPEECTFTALAGTTIVEIERALASHGQYLPFDPPLAAAGATIGGTVAAGVNGSCRYRFGGIRDFIIGARIVDGEGRVVQSGGKVVKNAAGFLLHQAVVGSCGTAGIVAEVTFKVFPAPEAHATLLVDAGDLATALAVMATIQRGRFDLEAFDLAPPGLLCLRFGGFRDTLDARVEALTRAVGRDVQVLFDDQDEALWRSACELAWIREGDTLVRVPTTLPRIGDLGDVLSGYDADRRHAVAGNLTWVGWRAPLDALDEILRGQGLVGQVLLGASGRPFIGAVAPNAFEERLRSVMDPNGRFARDA